MDPKEGLKHPFFVPSKGVPLVGTFCVRVSVGEMPFATLKFSSASRKTGTNMISVLYWDSRGSVSATTPS